MSGRVAIAALLLLPVLAPGCDKTREATNHPPIIASTTIDPPSFTVAPEANVALTMVFSDPDELAPDPQSFTFTWTIATPSGITPPPDLEDSLLVADDNPGRWRAPTTPGVYILTGAICDRFDDCAQDQLSFLVDPDALENTAPRIVSLIASDLTPLVGEQITLSVTAEDDEGDALEFEWTTESGGSLQPNIGASVQWTGTEAEPIEVTVLVSDGRGGTDSASTVIDVRNP